MKKNDLINTVLLGAILFLASCTAKDGATGPAGAAGTNGNANVQSVNLTASVADWASFGTNNLPGFGYSVTKPVIQLTSGVVNSASITAYVSFDNMVTYTAIPFTDYSTAITRSWQFTYKQNSVTFTFYDSDFKSHPLAVPVYFKVVIIPSGSLVKNMDHSDYQSVKKAYHLD
ncbi:MAG: hypothetical protein ACHQK8_01765 [Bacteroidia bacterium]